MQHQIKVQYKRRRKRRTVWRVMHKRLSTRITWLTHWQNDGGRLMFYNCFLCLHNFIYFAVFRTLIRTKLISLLANGHTKPHFVSTNTCTHFFSLSTKCCFSSNFYQKRQNKSSVVLSFISNLFVEVAQRKSGRWVTWRCTVKVTYTLHNTYAHIPHNYA